MIIYSEGDREPPGHGKMNDEVWIMFGVVGLRGLSVLTLSY